MNVYLIRHGQTTGNLTKRVQGWTEVNLTELGRNQAARAKLLLSGIEFDKIYASDLRRTRTTAEIIFGNDAEITYDARLREINNTVLAGKSPSELRDIYGERYERAIITLDYKEIGGEGIESFMERTGSFLEDLEKLCESSDFENKNIAVVTHGGTIHAMLARILKSQINLGIMPVENCSVTLLCYSHNKWKIRRVNYTGTLN